SSAQKVIDQELSDFYNFVTSVVDRSAWEGSALWASGPAEYFPLYDCTYARSTELENVMTNSIRINWLDSYARSLPSSGNCDRKFMIGRKNERKAGTTRSTSDEGVVDVEAEVEDSIQIDEDSAYEQCASVFLRPAWVRVSPPAQSLRKLFRRLGNALGMLHFNLRHYCFILNYLFRHFGAVEHFALVSSTSEDGRPLERSNEKENVPGAARKNIYVFHEEEEEEAAATSLQKKIAKGLPSAEKFWWSYRTANDPTQDPTRTIRRSRIAEEARMIVRDFGEPGRARLSLDTIRRYLTERAFDSSTNAMSDDGGVRDV
ncbi:unnamed protein product, partial [Amoebophrya sp. A25]